MAIFQTKYSGDNFWNDLVTHQPLTDGNDALHAILLVYGSLANTKHYHFVTDDFFWVTWTMPSSQTGLDLVIKGGIELSGLDFDASAVVAYDGTVDSLNVLSMTNKGVSHSSDEDGNYFCTFYTGDTRTFNMSTQYWMKLKAPATGNFIVYLVHH
jgi:hypothetical protein